MSQQIMKTLREVTKKKTLAKYENVNERVRLNYATKDQNRP